MRFGGTSGRPDHVEVFFGPPRDSAEALMVLEPTVRILVLGLGDFDQGNEGIGGRLARSLFASFHEVEVRPASDFHGFSEILHDYDLVIVLKSLSYCGKVGHVSLGSAYALDGGWGIHPARTEDLANAINYGRLMGHTLPRIEVVNVCVGAEEWPERGLSPTVSSMYRGIVGRVRGVVRDLIRQAELAARQPLA